MALEGDQVGLENLFVDKMDDTETFSNVPDVESLFCYICSVVTEALRVQAPRVKKCVQCRKDIKEKIWTILENIEPEGPGPEIGG